MPTCKCPGKMKVGSLEPYNGVGRGQTRKIAWHNLIRNSTVLDGYLKLMSLALEYDCKGDCQIRTHYSIKPAAQFQQDPNTQLWEAAFSDVEIVVWVECTEQIEA